MERLEFKAAFTADDTGAIEGTAWDFSSPDRVGDVITPEAFRSAVGKSLPMLFAHSQEQVLGTWDSVSVAADGLKVSGKLLVKDVVRAKEVHALLLAKSVTGLSVGFLTKKAAPRAGGGRTISDLSLLEVSLVAIPAHPGAQISNIKDLSMTAAAETTEIEVKAADLKAANDNIAALEKRLVEAETKLARPAIISDKKDQPTEEQKAFGNYLRLGHNTPVEDVKTLTVSSDPGGGYLAPSEMSTEFIRNLVQFSPIRSVASVRATSAPSVIYPKRTGITQARWKGEVQSSQASEPAFGQLEIPMKTLTTYVDISDELLADSAGQAEAEVRLALAEDFGKTEATAFLTGDGVLSPKGILNVAGIAETVSGATAALTADAFINLYYALPLAYRSIGAWAMNGTTLGNVRKLKDGQGNYLWQPSFAVGLPETILGRPVVEMLDMPDVAANAYPIMFGDWQQYRIVDRLALSIKVDPYTQATNTITRIHAVRRVGGELLKTEAFRKMKVST